VRHHARGRDLAHADAALDFLGIYYEALDRFAHAFMEFHPPKAAHLRDEEFERYKDVMTAGYRSTT